MSQRSISTWLLALVEGSFPLPGRMLGSRAGKRETVERAIALAGVLLLLFGSSSLGQDRFRAEFLRRSEPLAQFGWAVATGDFDGDGRDDLAVGIPRSTAYGEAMAGRVCLYFDLVFYRRARTPGTNVPSVCVTQGSSGAEAFDHFGFALAFGDFNGDGLDDLVVGSPYENVGNFVDAGAVHVYSGNVNRSFAAAVYSQGMPFRQGQRLRTLLEVPEAGDRFGQALAVGDLDGDGFDDLAVGAPGEDVQSTSLAGPHLLADAGIVHVLYGDGGGLGVTDQVWGQGRTLSMGEDTDYELPEAGDQFGYSLATGRFSGRSSDDLAIGVPFEDRPDGVDAGGVHVMYGHPGLGLRRYWTDFWDQSRAADWLHANGYWSQRDWSEPMDRFGFAVAGGDLNGDGIDDLAIGVPGEDLNRGGVHVLRGGSGWLTDAGTFGSPSDGAWTMGYELGRALTFGDFNGDGIDDLVVGIPGDVISVVSTAGGWIPAAKAGSVDIIVGEVPVGGVFEFGNSFQYLPDCYQNVGSTPGLETDPAEAGDRYGYSVAAGDFDGDGADDLVVGIPFEDTISSTVYPDGGAVEVLPGYVYP